MDNIHNNKVIIIFIIIMNTLFFYDASCHSPSFVELELPLYFRQLLKTDSFLSQSSFHNIQ